MKTNHNTLLLPTSKTKNLSINSQMDHLKGELSDIGAQVIAVDIQGQDFIFPSDYMLSVAPSDIVISSLPSSVEDQDIEQAMILAAEDFGYKIKDVTDFSGAAQEELYLYGASSVIIDQQNKVAYCMISSHSDEDILIELCEEYDLQPVIFHAKSEFEYTQQVLHLSGDFAIVALDALIEKSEIKDLIDTIKQSGREIIKINSVQANNFCSQGISISDDKGKKHLLLSSRAYQSLNEAQISDIGKYCQLHYMTFNAVEELYNRGLSSVCLPIYLEKED